MKKLYFSLAILISTTFFSVAYAETGNQTIANGNFDSNFDYWTPEVIEHPEEPGFAPSFWLLPSSPNFEAAIDQNYFATFEMTSDVFTVCDDPDPNAPGPFLEWTMTLGSSAETNLSQVQLISGNTVFSKNKNTATEPAEAFFLDIGGLISGSEAEIFISHRAESGLFTASWDNFVITGCEAEPVADIYTYAGFEKPAIGHVIAGKRAIPIKVTLFDIDGAVLTDIELGEFPPVIGVKLIDTETGEEAVPLSTAETLPVGQGSDNNQLDFSDGKWRYNLKLDRLTAPGTYAVTIRPGSNTYELANTEPGFFIIIE